jgi:glycosyltransferase involved in cell wall biosynthesis
MTDIPAVSILMPFLNSEKFLSAAIESVFAQTFDSWELLLIDDGSTDGSTEIACGFASQRPRKVWYLEHPSHANRGISASQNLGFGNARGRYIAFLDSDDVWLPDKLRQQVLMMDRMPNVGMTCGASKYWYSWTGNRSDRDRDHIVAVGAPSDTATAPPKLLTLLYPLGKGPSPCMNSMLVRRTIFSKVGGFEERFHSFYTDQAFLVKIYLTTSIFVAGAHYDLYRQHAASAVRSARDQGRYHSTRHSFLCWLEAYLSSKGAQGSPGWRALQEALWRYRHPFFAKATALPARALQLLESVLSV